MGRKKKVKIGNEDKYEDRISRLPDELIHQILSFLDTRLAVQTSILSKRWRLIWTTLPFLNLCWYSRNFPYRPSTDELKCIEHVLSHRDDQSQILKLKFYPTYTLNRGMIEKLINYAISHNVQNLHLDLLNPFRGRYKLSTFSSHFIEKLRLAARLEFFKESESDIWNLPALKTLDLRCPFQKHDKLPESCLICLPSLQTLCLDDFELPESFSLLGLTTLCLARCNLPQRPCNLPSLLTLVLDDVVYPANMSEFLCALVSLKNLTIIFKRTLIKDCLINCPRLVNLKITSTTTRPCGNIMVLTPKICNFTSVGIFPITFGGSELENVNVKLRDRLKCPSKKMEQYYRRFTFMFPGFGSAKILALDLETIEALLMISDFLAPFTSPFYNLKYLKLPEGYKESSMIGTIRRYLLGGSPRATILTTWPQKYVISQTAPASSTAQKVALEEPLATPTEEFVDSQDIHRKLCFDNTVEMRMQEEHVVKSSGIDAGSVKQVGCLVPGFGGLKPNALVARPDNDQARSSKGNSDFGLWQGHEINSEFIGLLDLIMKKFPETFEHFTTKSKKFCTMKLNMFCTSVNAFTKTSMTEVDAEMVTEYRALFSDLQSWGFNVKWLVSRLNYIAQLLFSPQLLNELHAFDSRLKKMTEICPASGTMGTSGVVDYIGDDLFSGS